MEAPPTRDRRPISVNAAHAALTPGSPPFAAELPMTQPHGLNLRGGGVRGAGQVETLGTEAIQAARALADVQLGHVVLPAATGTLLVIPNDLPGKTGHHLLFMMTVPQGTMSTVLPDPTTCLPTSHI